MIIGRLDSGFDLYTNTTNAHEELVYDPYKYCYVHKYNIIYKTKPSKLKEKNDGTY